VLSVLVIEDFAMAVYLPLLAVLATGGTWWQALIGIVVAVAVVAGAVVGSLRWARHVNRWLAHPDPEQLMLRLLGTTLVVVALAEMVHISTAIGALPVGLTLTEQTAKRARAGLAPLRDLFAAAFFVPIGLAVRGRDGDHDEDAHRLVRGRSRRRGPTRTPSGRDCAHRPGRVLDRHRQRAGINDQALGDMVVAYVLLSAVIGPLLARYLPSVIGWQGRFAGIRKQP
jgi:CPA2 family monovalent cation:H+ antiporter-2